MTSKPRTAKLPPTLQRYVDHIARCGKPLELVEIIAITPKVNRVHNLIERGLIEQVATTNRAPKYVLTATGLGYVSR